MEATPEEQAEGLAIVRVLAAVLDRLVCANSSVARTEPGQVTKFHALKAPGIGIQQYLERIHKYACCSNQCFIMALIYIDRLIQRNSFLLTELNVHRVIVTAILLAAKFFDDSYYNNAYYAKVGGVLVSEINGLEVDFLFRINFSLHVTPEVFEQYRVELLSHLSKEALQMPPQPSMTMEQLVAPIQQHLQQQQRQQQQQCQVFPPQTRDEQFPPQQQQPTLYNPNGVMPFNGVSKPRSASSQITPSPPRGTAYRQQQQHKPEDDMMMSVDQPTLRSNINLMYQSQQDFAYLQRANSLPVQAKSLVQQVISAQQQPLSAPAMMAMVPGVLSNQMMDQSNDQFVVLENQIYQIPNMMSRMDASDLIHHVHHPGGVSQGFAAGQMVAGVSGGL